MIPSSTRSLIRDITDWIVDSLIGSDPFARGGMYYLKRVLRWATSSSLSVILDLHGGPGSQTVHQSFTGHTVDKADFFSNENYQKAWDCLRNLTVMVHTDDDFSNGELLSTIFTSAESLIRSCANSRHAASTQRTSARHLNWFVSRMLRLFCSTDLIDPQISQAFFTRERKRLFEMQKLNLG